MQSTRQPVLILFAHPAFEKSSINTVLVDAVRDLPGVTFRDLYEEYPDFAIRPEVEQELLLQHEIIVLHHPFYWYSSPAILKEYQDLVLQHGWAYGAGGEALKGKTVLQVVTTGGQENAYQPAGMNRFTMREMLVPFEQTARLCQMEYLPPFIVHGAFRVSSQEVRAHAAHYATIVAALRDGTLDRAAVNGFERINAKPALAAMEIARG